MPGRILDRHVGGNTTYARAVAHGLRSRGVEVGSLRCFGNAALTLASETVEGLRRRGDVLHYTADTGPLLRTTAPSVVTVHGIASRHVAGVRDKRQERVWRTRVRRAIASTDAVIAVSHSGADDVAAVFDVPRDQIHVIPHGIESAKFAAPTEVSGIGTALPQRFLLYVGNIEPRKNLVALAHAMANPAVTVLGLPLVVAGKPAWNFADTLAAFESNPQIIYLGFVSDADRAALMQRAVLFVFPSLYEGFGFPVLEAMAAGAPVLTSHAGSLVEVAGPAKIVADTDSESIAAGIVDALGDSSWLSSAAGRGREWSSRFTWDASVDAHLAVYGEVSGA